MRRSDPFGPSYKFGGLVLATNGKARQFERVRNIRCPPRDDSCYRTGSSIISQRDQSFAAASWDETEQQTRRSGMLCWDLTSSLVCCHKRVAGDVAASELGAHAAGRASRFWDLTLRRPFPERNIMFAPRDLNTQ